MIIKATSQLVISLAVAFTTATISPSANAQSTYQFDCEAFVESFADVLVAGALFKGTCAAGLKSETDLKSVACASMRGFDSIIVEQAPLSKECFSQLSETHPTQIIVGSAWEIYGDSHTQYTAKLNQIGLED